MNKLRCFRFSVWLNGAFHKERGSAMLEFALLLPVILVIGLGGMELSYGLKLVQISTVLSREAAASAYRNCILPFNIGDTTVDPNPETWVQECIDDVRIQVEDISIVPGSYVTVTVGMYDSAYCGTDHWCTKESKNGAAPNSRFLIGVDRIYPDSGGDIELNTALGGTGLQDRKVFAVAEANIRYRSMVGNVLQMFHFAPEWIYDATLI